MAKTEEQIMLERLGILEDTTTSDDDFENESPEVNEEFISERERLQDWEFQLERRESEANAQERDIARERQRLNERERALDEREAELDELLHKNKLIADKAEYVLDDDVLDEVRRKKKIDRLKRQREEATAEESSVWAVGGWNTNT